MQRNYSLHLRIWHWLNAIAITGLLATFFLRKTFLSWKDNADIILNQLTNQGIDITAEEAAVVAKAIRAPMWEWHIIFGIMLAILLIYRVLILIKEGGFGYEENASLHKKMVYFGYKLLYLVLIIMAISGLLIHWHEAVGLSKDFTHTIKEMHEIIAWFVVVFVPLHIAGVVIADNSDQKGITSHMISG